MKMNAWVMAVCATAGGCGAVEESGDAMTGPEVDTTAPSVASSMPAAGATGVASDAKIHVTFSEPMDPATVTDAYSSSQLPLDKVSMTWNADQTVLTISPDQPLLYGEGIGNDPSVAGRIEYVIAIAGTATDLAGNALGAGYALKLSTKVRMHTTAALLGDLSRPTLGGSALGTEVNILVGDATLNNLPYRGYASFDLAALPAGIAIESAQFAARQVKVEGAPYTALGPLQVYHLSFSTMTDVSDVLATSNPGVLSQDGNAESKSIDVTSQVADDIAHRVERSDRSQYRLQFDTTTNGDNAFDRVELAKDTFEMSLVYVAD